MGRRYRFSASASPSTRYDVSVLDRSRSLAAMRVPRTFVFADLSGFTNYTAANGDDAAAFLLSSFRAVVREVASDRGVRVAKWLGDGCMIVAVDHSDGVAAALDLDERARKACAPLALRVGVASGYSLLFEGDDYIGLAVNLAARLCDAAGPYEVLMPAEQLDELPEGVTAIPYGDLALRGFPQPVSVVTLAGLPVPSPRHDTGELWTRSPYVA
jgi:adenylate cyclase